MPQIDGAFAALRLSRSTGAFFLLLVTLLDLERVVRSDPRSEYFRRLVGEPTFQDHRVIAVIGHA
jgi:hypothetical protein